MERTVRVGIVGAGGIANFHHIPSLLKHPGAQITAVCDVVPEAAEETARRHGIAQVYADYHDLIREAPVDAVAVCTSNDQHAPVSLAAIERGLHVLCEKPLALSAGQAQELADAAAKAGVITAVNFSYRQNPAVRFIKDVIDSGDLGIIYQVSFQYLQGHNADPETPLRPAMVWRAQKRFAGLGVLGDLGSHLVDLARYWFGEIDAVQALQRTFVTQRPLVGGGSAEVDGDDATVALLSFANGMVGTLQTSWSAAPWGNHQRVEIYGSKGSIVYENEDQRTVRAVFGSAMFKYRTLAPIAVPQRYHDTATNHPAAFVDAVLRGEQYTPGFAEGARCQLVLDTIARAADEGVKLAVE